MLATASTLQVKPAVTLRWYLLELQYNIHNCNPIFTSVPITSKNKHVSGCIYDCKCLCIAQIYLFTGSVCQAGLYPPRFTSCRDVPWAG
jgi:hypothetical protein